jgi:membrane fusion protein (multidrug efflux system)
MGANSATGKDFMPDDHATDKQPPEGVVKPRRFPASLVSLAILFLAGGVFFLVYGNWNRWESDRPEQRTDDAYVRADVTALSTKATGLLARLEVSDYQHVDAGQEIAALRDDDYKAAVDSAQAALNATLAELPELRRQAEIADAKTVQTHAAVAAAESQIAAAEAGVAAAASAIRSAEAGLTGVRAQFDNATQESERQEGLLAEKAATLQKAEMQRAQTASARALFESRQQDVKSAQAQADARAADLKRAQSALESARADVVAATGSRRLVDAKEAELRAEIEARRAALESARIALGYTVIKSPSNGYIASRNVLPGQMVAPGTTVVSLVEQTPWIQANFKETQLTRMRAGDEAEIRVDTFPGRSWKGHVLLIAPVTGAQTALLPPDNATGNFTKIVQRIPVKITLDPDRDLESLRPGMSVTVVVKTGKGA